jgi:hypothetical protein
MGFFLYAAKLSLAFLNLVFRVVSITPTLTRNLPTFAGVGLLAAQMKSKKNAAQQAGPHLVVTTEVNTAVVNPLVVRRVSEVCCGASDLREKIL